MGEVSVPQWVIAIAGVLIVGLVGLAYERADRRVNALEAKMEVIQIHVNTLESKMQWVIENRGK